MASKAEEGNPATLFMRSFPRIAFEKKKMALIVIDMQYLDAHPDFGIVKQAVTAGLQAKWQWYINRLPVIEENIRLLQQTFREKRMEVIHVKIASLTKDGRDRSLLHKKIGFHAPPDSKEAQILEKLAPQGDEIVFTKTSASVFNSTNIDYVLKNIGIEQLVIGGVQTNGCVELAIRDAADKGYQVALVEDCCAAITKELHENSISRVKDINAIIYVAAEIVQIISPL